MASQPRCSTSAGCHLLPRNLLVVPLVDMQVPNPELASRHGTVTEHSGSFDIRPTRAYACDHESPSGSDFDDAGNLVYSDPNKMDTDLDDDPNASLTSQSLNPDGTPKRPMNAFMIFARRRRPQVSAENQSMRTGEISKILSREWNVMDTSEKQFYLDQAKQLKDTFNQKYPDYVYKRRPNNSRRRRKTDASIGSADLQSTADSIDECSLEYPDTSPVDPAADLDEPRYTGYDTRHSSVSAETAPSSGAASHPRGATYPPSEPPTYGLQHGVPYPSSHHERPQSDIAISAQPSAHGLESGPPFYQGFQPSQMQLSYFAVPGQDERWSPSVGDGSTRIPTQSWPQSNQDHAHARERRGYEQQMPSHGWPSANRLDPGAAPGPRSSNYSFPTLTAPFYPTQGNSQNSYSTLPSVSQTIPSPYPSAMQAIPPQGRAGVSYDVGSYPSQHPVQSTLPGSSTARNPYQHVRDALPSSPPLANYPQMQQSLPPGSGRGAQRRH